MSGLSRDLIERCRIVFQRCHEFDDLLSLRAVFISEELVIFRDRLPEPGNREQRVDQTIEFLWLKFLTDGRPVFPHFIRSLSTRYPLEDQLHNELDELRVEVEQNYGAISTVEVPIIVAAMLDEEAAVLANQAIFDNSVARVERDRFLELQQALEQIYPNWVQNYRGRRDTWTPHTVPEHSIEEIVSFQIEELNLHNREPTGLPLLQRIFISENAFNEDVDIRSQTWEYVNHYGGVVIIDAVSLFHPTLRNELIQSGTLLNENIAILFLSPVNTSILQINALIEDMIKTQLRPSYVRFDMNLDNLCEIGAGNLRSIQRWLFAALPETVKNIQEQSRKKNQRLFQRRMGYQPRGIDEPIFSLRGEG